MEGRKFSQSSHRRHASQGESIPVKSAQHLPQEMVIKNPWPVTKFERRKDTVLEAAQVLVRARNAELIINICSNAIVLLPASGDVPGVQGGSRERPLYSLRPPRLKPFKIHLWQIPPVQTWNRITWSWDVTPGKIMVRQGLKSQPFARLLKSLGVAEGEAKMSDLCNHFRCWRSLNTRGEWLNDFPRHLRGMIYQRWWSFNGFHFLRLPPELREMILTFAMGPIAIPFARRWRPKRCHRLTMPNMRLSLVSKQLNREVIATLLAHTTFYFHNIDQFVEFFRHADNVSRGIYQPLRGIRFLELDLNPYGLLNLFGVSFGPRDTRYERRFALDPGKFFNDEFAICRQICIRIPHLFQHNPPPDHSCCQKVHNLAFWAGARARLRNIAVVKMVGHIDETQKKEWLAEHALERRGIIPEEKDFAGWQRGIWTQW